MNNKLLVLQGGLYTTIAMLTSCVTVLASDAVLSTRTIILMTMSALIAGATALKAFLSTTFSDSPQNPNPKPPNGNGGEPRPVVIEQPASKPIPTTEVKP